MVGWIWYFTKLPPNVVLLFDFFEQSLPDPHSLTGKVVGTIIGVLFMIGGLYCLKSVKSFRSKDSEEDYDYRCESEQSPRDAARRRQTIYDRYCAANGDAEPRPVRPIARQ